MFFSLFCYMTFRVNYYNYSWFAFLFYIIPLRYFLTGLRASFKLYTKFYTFLPYFEPYLFMVSLEKQKKLTNTPGHKKKIKNITFLAPDFLSNKKKIITMNSNKPVNIISSNFLSRFSATPLVFKLNDRSSSDKIKHFCILNENIEMDELFKIAVKKLFRVIGTIEKLE